MSRAGPTLIGALVILVSMPIALFVFQNMWRARMEQPLPEARPPVRSAARIERSPAPAPENPPAPTVALRPVDELLIGVFEGRGPGPGTDLLPDGPRVDLLAKGDGSVARVDLDRDGAWDEVWAIRLDEVVREVSPRDDGHLTERWAWTNGAWAPLPPASP
jgi:hypothetical protein